MPNTGTTRASRSRIAFVAAALVVFLEGGGTRTSNNHGLFLGVEAFVLPSSPLTPGLLPNVLLQQQQQQQEEDPIFPLRSFKYIKGESSYGDLVDGTVTSGMIGGMLAGSGSSTSISGFGGLTTKSSNRSRSMGTNSLASAKRRSFPAWWSSKSGFSRTTPTTLLAAGSIESWPVLEADDIQILVRKGEAIDDEDLDDDEEEEEYDDSGYPIVRKPSSSVKATLERWERDIALEVVGLDGYPMIGNEMQPTPNNYYYSSNNYGEENNDRCTQKIEFNVANGDLYPFSGTVSVPPPLTVEDSTGNQQTVMMVLNNPDEEEDGDAGFGNALLPGSSSSSSLVRQQGGNTKKRSKRRGKTLEATIEPLYKSPDEKYAEAQVQRQQQQQQQYEFGYDEYGNEMYNPGSEKTTIPSQGYQSFQVDATDPASGKIKISLERDENSGGSGLGGAFRSAMGGGGGSSSNSDVSAARVEIYHGFRDLDGNYHSYNPEEDDKRISLDVSTMHPSFSSVVDTMPSELLAKHALSVPDANNYDPRVSAYQPYLEVRIVNTGGAALKAGVESYMPFYKSRSQQEKEAQQRERRREQFQRRGTASLPPATTVKADDPFLLVDSAQSSTSSRRIHNTFPNQSQKSYVSAKRTRRVDNTRAETLQGFGGNSNKFMETRESGVKPDVPGGSARLGGTSESRKKFARTEQRQFSLPSYNDSNSPQRQRNNKKKSDYDRYGMGTSLNDRVPESPLSPDDDDDGRSMKLGSGQTIDTIATTPGGSVSGRNSNKLALASFGGNGGSISGMQGRQGREQQLRDGGYYQNSQAQTSRVLGNGNSIGDGVMNGRPASAGTSPFAAYGSVSETNTNRYNGNNSNNRLAGNGGFGSGTNKQNIGAFAGNGRVIGDGVIKGQNSTPGGFSGYSSGNVILGNDKSFSSGSFNNNNNNNGFSGQSNNSNRLGGGTKPFGSYNGNSNNDSFGGNTMNNYSNDVSDSPFGNMGRPPQTTGNSKNPFATMNGESSDTSNNSSPFGGSPSNSFSSNNSFNSNSNGFNSNNSFGGGGMGSPQRPQQPNAAGRASAMKNPFSGLNGSSSGNVAKSSPFGKTGGANSNAMGSQNSSPFGSIGSPSTTAMRSRNFDSDYVEDEAESSSSSENPLMGFAKSLVKGITGS